MSRRKSDANQITGFLHQLLQKDWIKRTERRWWPQYVFHYTDIRNALCVLKDGYLHSRNYVENAGRLVVSSGSPDVLARTSAFVKDCVRLYFRPKTPTQYYAEGIHSQESLAKSRFPEAHCPVPIFFLFDSNEILTREDCLFSDRSLSAANSQVLSKATELAQMPWEQIYHNSPLMDPDSKKEIASRRMAEIVVPGRLDLDALRFLYCRSEAEKDTLLHLLPPNLRHRYQNRIVATTHSDLYFRHQTFVEQAILSFDSIHLRFSPDTKSPGPFHLHVRLTNKANQTIELDEPNFMLKCPFNYTWRLTDHESCYDAQIHLDTHLTYANSYKEITSPV